MIIVSVYSKHNAKANSQITGTNKYAENSKSNIPLDTFTAYSGNPGLDRKTDYILQ